MCLIAIRHPGAGIHIKDDVIDYNLKSNPDGFGIAWREGSTIRHEKFAPSEAANFKQLLLEVDADDSVEYVAHWRKATHGPACKELSHPFVYSDENVGDVFIFHNGIIPIKTDPHESDTSAFVESVLSRLPSRWWEDTAITFLVEQSVSWSRFAVMTKDTIVRLEGSKSWQEKDGLWYSAYPGPYPYTPKGEGAGTFPQSSKSSSGAAETARTAAATAEAGAVKRVTENPLLPEGVKTTISETKGPPASKLGKAEATGKTGAMKDRVFHQGHWVEKVSKEEVSIADLDDDDDEYGVVRCTKCGTIGEYLVIESKVYVDIVHAVDLSDDDDEFDTDSRGNARWMSRLHASYSRGTVV